MRKIIVTEFITLDGVIEAPGGDETDHPHAGWQFKYDSDVAGQYKVDEISSVSALLLGRKTFDVFAGYWPKQSGDPFSGPINEMPKYVVSTTVNKTDWNNCHFLKDVATDVAALKLTEGGDILVYGSASIVKELLKHELVDELRLMVHPLSVGGGLRIFDDSREMKKFDLKHSVVTKEGILILEYKPVKPNDYLHPV